MNFKKIRRWWLYSLVFVRPFISSQAFPEIEKYFLVLLIPLGISFLKEIKRKNNPLILDLALFLYVAGCLSSLFFSTNKLNSLFSSPTYLTGILFFLIALTLSNEEIKKIIKIILYSGFFVSLYGLYQYLFGFSQTADYILETNPYFFTNHLIRNYLLSRRVFSTFLSPNILAGYLIMLLPLSIGNLFETKEKKINIFYLFTVMFFSVLILTKSLGGILSLVISFLVLFLIIKPKNIPKKFLILGLIILTFLCVFVFFARANRIVDFRNPHNSLLQRYNFIRVSIKIARDNLLWGVGMGNFGDFFMRYRSASDIRTNYAHNFILQTQTELGILGSVGLFLLILVFLRDIFTKKNKLCFFNFSLLWAGTSFLFHNLIDISFFFPEVAIFFWIIWAGFKNLSK